MAASVTSFRHDAGATVLDERRQAHAQLSAASLGGDVVSTDQVPVPLKVAEWTGELATFGFGDPPPADRAGGRRAALVHQPHDHAGEFCFIAQGLQQVGAAPPPQAQVLHPADGVVGNPFGVTNHQGAYPVLDGKGDHLLGGLMLSLMDAATVTLLDTTHPCPVASPAPRSALPGLRCAPAGLSLPCPLILKVEVVLGADRPSRRQQSHLLGHHGVGVNDSQIYPGDPTGI
jgi:hypothetical protein